MLQQPWHMLHPCQTADLMALLLQPSSSSGAGAPSKAGPAPGSQPANGAGTGGEASWLLRYMLAWWSLVGPAVGLPVHAAAGAAAGRMQ